jgi:hypothetical protein
MLASLQDAMGYGTVNRWCRRVAPRPPANGWQASGLGEQATIPVDCIQRTTLNILDHPEGMRAISRGLREARAPPPE